MLPQFSLVNLKNSFLLAFFAILRPLTSSKIFTKTFLSCRGGSKLRFDGSYVNEFLRFTSENKVDLDELYNLKITFKNSLELVWGMSHNISHRIFSRISHKIFPQEFSARFPTRISHKNSPQGFPARFSPKNFPQDFPQDFPPRFSHKISRKIFPQDFPQDFRARFSSNHF